MKERISVVLATYNEEDNLRQCLDSIKDLADEIVIVDGSSTDNTVGIAKKYKARIKITTNKLNFHVNKQMAIDMATSDWILQLDADEVVSPELAGEIKEKIGNWKLEIGNSRISGYWIPRKNLFLGRFLMKGGQYPDYTLRLYRKGKGRLPRKDVHEQAVVEGKVDYLKNPLLHYSYRNFARYLEKWNSYNDFFAKQIGDEQKEKNFPQKIFYGFGYLFLKPIHWLLTTYLRHKGFMDGWQGLVFSFFSALRFPISYVKYLGMYKISMFFIIILSFFLRFWYYSKRWGLAYDQARDVIVSNQALLMHKLPLIGPFSASGSFVFGPYIYWIYALVTSIDPSSVMILWIFQTSISVFMPIVMFLVGREMLNKRFGLLLALFTALSTAQIAQSTNLTYSTFVGFIAMFVFLFALKTIKEDKDRYFFILSFAIGIAVNIHFQALGLIFLFFLTPFVSRFSLKRFILMLLGFSIAFVPLTVFDFLTNHFESKHLLVYLLAGGNIVYLPKRWLTYIDLYWPSTWSRVIGGSYLVTGYTIGIAVVIATIYAIFKKRISKTVFYSLTFFFINLVALRYYKGPLFDAFVVYLHPVIILLTGWSIFIISKIDKYAAVLLFVIICIFTLVGDYKEIANTTNTVAYDASTYMEDLRNLYPNKKFRLYDYKFQTNSISFPTVMYLMKNDLISDSGEKIGFATATNSAQLKSYRVPLLIKTMQTSNVLLNLNHYNNYQLKKLGWVFINPSQIYKSTEEWWK